MPHNVSKNSVDVVQIFQTYMTLGGDAAKTAAACGVSMETIESLVKAERWKEKVTDWLKLQHGSPKELQVQINRAVQYVQAHRWRGVLDRLVNRMAEKTPEELEQFLRVETKEGGSFSGKVFTDLTKALEAVHAMTARSLGDTAAERNPALGADGSDVALQVMRALDGGDKAGVSSVQLIRDELATRPLPSNES